MKQFFKIVLVVAINFISFGIFAQTRQRISTEENMIDVLQSMSDSLGLINRPEVVTKEIKLAEQVREVRVLGDVTLFLTNGSQNDLHLKGDPLDLDQVKVRIKNGRLFVNAERKMRSGITISVPVTGVSLLHVDGDSKIFSSGILNTRALQIVLDGTSVASVRYTGKLNVTAGTHSDLINIDEYFKIVSRH